MKFGALLLSRREGLRKMDLGGGEGLGSGKAWEGLAPSPDLPLPLPLR